jgi:MMPL family
MLEFKQMGVGLALAVLIDATIIRAVLLPATMKLLGDWNWYLPKWLDWLPGMAPERPAPVIAATLDEPLSPARLNARQPGRHAEPAGAPAARAPVPDRRVARP